MRVSESPNMSNEYSKFFVRQKSIYDCGLACVKMISNYYGLTYGYTLDLISNSGTSIRALMEEFIGIGLKAIAIKISVDNFLKLTQLPCILHYNGHFAVIFSIKSTITIGDPYFGMIEIDPQDFVSKWILDDSATIVLVAPDII